MCCGTGALLYYSFYFQGDGESQRHQTGVFPMIFNIFIWAAWRSGYLSIYFSMVFSFSWQFCLQVNLKTDIVLICFQLDFSLQFLLCLECYWRYFQ